MFKGLKKRAVTVILAGCLALSGAVAYGSAMDVVFQKAQDAALSQMKMVPACSLNGIESDLAILASEGVITHAQTVTLINAIQNAGFSAEELKALAEMNGGTVYDRLADTGAIARSLADSIDKAIKARKEVQFAQAIKPKAEAGTFTSVAGDRP